MMHYVFKTLIPLFILSVFAGCTSTAPLSSKKQPHTVAFYNVERLYDTQGDPNANDKDFLPAGAMKWDQAKYTAKLKALATTIQTMGGKNGPAIIGLSEVENRKVLEDLVNMPALQKHNYDIIHYDSPEESGLDVALLYKPAVFKPTSHRTIPVPLNERNFKAKDILEVKGTLHGEQVTIYVNHWPSGRVSRQQAAATTLRAEIEALQKADANAKIIAMGDFDEAPNSPVLRQVLKATGRPDPAYNKELFNTFYIPHVQGMGSYFSKGKFIMLDQILISKSWIDDRQKLRYVRGSSTIHDPAALKNLYGKYKHTPRPTYTGTVYMGGTSDHFPVYIKVQKFK